jgi:hypothetical protein
MLVVSSPENRSQSFASVNPKKLSAQDMSEIHVRYISFTFFSCDIFGIFSPDWKILALVKKGRRKL